MDDLEFHTRAHSNPFDEESDFLGALSGREDRRRLLDELKQLDHSIRLVTQQIEVPDRLRQKLAAPDNRSWLGRRAFAFAASLVLAAGFVFSTMQYRPSASELALHDAMLEHVYAEAPRYEQITVPISWLEVETVLADAGVSLHQPEGEETLIITFAKVCGLGGTLRGAHLVTMGKNGPVSVILVRSTPIGRSLDVKDPRFQGRIVPSNDGNMAVIGEQAEELQRLEQIISSNVEWSI
ncbi:MAG: DUF3379 family protein [Pseudohongiella sp.]|nr:DUF3379 family protein [Pseudohongiella sp.]